MKSVIIIPTLIFVCLMGWSQKVTITGTEIKGYSDPQLEKELADFQVFKFNTQALDQLDLQRIDDLSLVISFPTDSWSLLLAKDELRAPSYVMQISTNDGIQSLGGGNTAAFNGVLLNGEKAYFTLDKQYLLGAVSRDGHLIYFEPLTNFNKKAPHNYFVVYEDDDVLPINKDHHSAAFEVANRSTEVFQMTAMTEENCVMADYALAADYLMFERYGDAYETERQMLAILNLVKSNFDDEFLMPLSFRAIQTYVSTCPECDPWLDTNDGLELLSDFTEWGNAGGFSDQSYDLATLWTGRVLADSLFGVGWIGEICSDNRYNIVREASTNSSLLRTVQAHQIGHNLGAVHDTRGDTTIMTPNVSTSNTWSVFSQLIIDRALVRYSAPTSCLEACVVEETPIVDFSGQTTMGCAPAEVQFESNISGFDLTRKWIFEGGTPATSTEENPVVVYENEGLYSVTLMAMNSSGEDTITKTGYIEIEGAPSASFTFDYTLGSQTVDFQSNSDQPGTNFFWDFGNDIVTNQTNPSHTYEFDGTYLVTMIASTPCGRDTVTQEIEIRGVPVASFSADPTSGCAPHTIQLTNMTTALGSSYQWILNGADQDTSTQENPSVTYSTPGVYSITLIATNDIGTDTITMSDVIEVFANPDATFSVDTTAGSTIVTIQDLSKGNDSTAWFINGIQTMPDNPFTVDLGTLGTHEITMVAINGCGVDSNTMVINLFDPPSASFDADPKIGCAPLTVNMIDFSMGSGLNYEWLFPGAIVDTSSLQNPVVIYETPGIYDVGLRVFNPGGEEAIEKTELIEVLGPPSADFAIQYSFGDSTVYFGDSTLIGDRYFWDFGDGDTSNLRTPAHTYGIDGTYDVTLIIENECGQDTVSKSVEVLFTPSAAFSLTNSSGCLPLTVDYTSLVGNSFGSILWVFDGGFPSETIEENPQVVYEKPGEYSVRMVVFSAFGLDSLVLEHAVTVDPVPVAGFTMEIDRNEVFFTNISEYADEYMWNFGDGTMSTDIDPVHRYNNPGNYRVELIAMNPCDTTVYSQEAIIETFRPRAGFSVPTNTGCEPFEVTLVNESFNAEEYTWHFPGGEPEFSTDSVPTVRYTNPGVYSIELMVVNSAGSALVEKENVLEVLPRPTANFSFEISDLTLTTQNLSVEAESYIWNFGDGFGSADENPVYTYQEPGEYMITLIARNGCGPDTTAIMASVGDITSTKEPIWAKQMTLYPNPNQGSFRLSISGENFRGTATATLLTTTGQQLADYTLPFSNGRVDQQLTANNLSTGVFLLRINYDNAFVYRKVIIQD